MVTLHIEAVSNPETAMAMAREMGLDFGLVINPMTEFAAIKPYVENCDMVLVMSVEPGFGGQSFMGEVLAKVEEARNFVDTNGLDTYIEIDGGIGPETIGRARDAGADVFVAGSAIFGTRDPVEAIADLRQKLDS